MKKIIATLILIITLSACTENQRAKSFGGTSTIKITKGHKLIDATWKGEDLWYLIRKRKSNETIESYVFKEESSFGLIQGKVIFQEQ